MMIKSISEILFSVCRYIIAATLFLTVACSTSKKIQTPAPQPPPPKPVVKEVQPSLKPAEQVVKPVQIALLLPLDSKKHLEALTDSSADIGMDNFTMSQLEFAEGALLAADSLNANAMTVDVKIIDAPADSFYLSNKLYRKDALNADVIIASVPSANAAATARIANMHKQKVVFTQPVATLDVPSSDHIYFAATSTARQCEIAASRLATYIPSAHYFLLTGDSKREKDIAALFKPGLPAAKTFLLSDKAKLDSIARQASRHEQAIIIVSSDEDYVASALNQLNASASGIITIMGLPTWENFESIDFSYLKNLKVLYFTTNYIDATSEQSKVFRNLFISRYNTEPLFSAYQGFELMMEFGRTQSEDVKKQQKKRLLPFKFVQVENHGSYENRYLKLVEIRNFELIPVE